MKMIDSEGVIDLLHGDGPSCPQSMGYPVHPSHQLANRFVDAVYEASPRDEDGEVAEAFEPVNHAVSYGESMTGRMRLYRQVATTMSRQGSVVVETLYFRCGLCGLILPANRV